MAAAATSLGPPRLVVACAGIVVRGPIAALAMDAFHRSMAVNYLSSLHLVRAALPLLPRPAGARIVLAASRAALIGLYGLGAYVPSTFAVRGLAEALRRELLPEGIAVSVVYPPDTDTPGYREELRYRLAITSLLAKSGGLMTADQVATAIRRGIDRDGASTHHGLIESNGPPGESMTTSAKDMVAAANAAVPRITREDAQALLADGKALLVDVRDAPELQAAGKIKGAKNVSRGMLEFRADPASPYHDPDFDPERTVILYCASGGRSALAGKALQELGYRDVRNLGAFKDWAESGGAVEPA